MQSLMWLLQFTAESPYLIEAITQINLIKPEFQIRTFFLLLFDEYFPDKVEFEDNSKENSVYFSMKTYIITPY